MSAGHAAVAVARLKGVLNLHFQCLTLRASQNHFEALNSKDPPDVSWFDR